MRFPKIALLALLAAPVVVVAQPAAAQTTIPYYQTFTGYTYPGTQAGLAACNAEGEWYASYYGYDSWLCKLGIPDPGLYGLYVVLHL